MSWAHRRQEGIGNDPLLAASIALPEDDPLSEDFASLFDNSEHSGLLGEGYHLFGAHHSGSKQPLGSSLGGGDREHNAAVSTADVSLSGTHNQKSSVAHSQIDVGEGAQASAIDVAPGQWLGGAGMHSAVAGEWTTGMQPEELASEEVWKTALLKQMELQKKLHEQLQVLSRP
jgi:hypothetical protein